MASAVHEKTLHRKRRGSISTPDLPRFGTLTVGDEAHEEPHEFSRQDSSDDEARMRFTVAAYQLHASPGRRPERYFARQTVASRSRSLPPTSPLFSPTAPRASRRDQSSSLFSPGPPSPQRRRSRATSQHSAGGSPRGMTVTNSSGRSSEVEEKAEHIIMQQIEQRKAVVEAEDARQPMRRLGRLLDSPSLSARWLYLVIGICAAASLLISIAAVVLAVLYPAGSLWAWQIPVLLLLTGMLIDVVHASKRGTGVGQCLKNVGYITPNAVLGIYLGVEAIVFHFYQRLDGCIPTPVSGDIPGQPLPPCVILLVHYQMIFVQMLIVAISIRSVCALQLVTMERDPPNSPTSVGAMLNEHTTKRIRKSLYPATFFIYLFFLIILIIGCVTEWNEWKTKSDPTMTVVFALVSYFVTESNRVDMLLGKGVKARNINVNVIVLVPLGMAAGTNYHIVVMLFFFVTLIFQLPLISLHNMASHDKNQKEKKYFRSYIMHFSMVFVIEFFILVPLMHMYGPWGEVRPTSFVSAVGWWQNFLTLAAIVCAGSGFNDMQKDQSDETSFRVEALNLVSEEMARTQMDDFCEEEFTSPLSRAIETIKHLISTGTIPASMQSALMGVLTQLQTNDVFQPDFTGVDPAMLHFMPPELMSRDEPLRRVRSASDHLAHIAVRRGSDDDAPARLHRSHSMTSASPILSTPYSKLMQDMGSWCCDTLALSKECPNLLSSVMMAVCMEHGLPRKLDLSIAKLQTLFSVIESTYHPTNPYHSQIHAADVVITLNNFLRHGLVDMMRLSTIEIFGALLAALVHDCGHPGVNNQFLVETNSELALIYNDQSVLENFHLHSFFRRFRDDDNDVLACLPRSDRRRLRDIIVKMVLATDMANHYHFAGRFANKLGILDPVSNPKERFLVLQIALKCADISNPAKNLTQAVAWASVIMSEFWRQGDMEKQMGLPVSAAFNRTIKQVASGQMGFIDFIVMPLFKSWGEYIGHAEYVEYIAGTRKYWADLNEEDAYDNVVSEMTAAGFGPPGDGTPKVPTPNPDGITSPSPPRSPFFLHNFTF